MPLVCRTRAQLAMGSDPIISCDLKRQLNKSDKFFIQKRKKAHKNQLPYALDLTGGERPAVDPNKLETVKHDQLAGGAKFTWAEVTTFFSLKTPVDLCKRGLAGGLRIGG